MNDRRADLRGVSFDDGARRIRDRRENERHSALRDAGFLERDLLDRLAENLGVIVADGGDRCDDRLDDVRSIETSAEANFDHGDVDAFLREVEECQCEQRFVKRRPAVARGRALDRRHHFVEQRGEAFARYRAAVDARALGHRVQVRLGVQTGPSAPTL